MDLIFSQTSIIPMMKVRRKSQIEKRTERDGQDHVIEKSANDREKEGGQKIDPATVIILHFLSGLLQKYLFLDKKRRKDSKEERKKSRDEPGTSGSSDKPKYFDEIEKDEVVTTDVSMKDIQKMAKKYDKKKTTVDKTGKDGISFGEVNSISFRFFCSYAFRYPIHMPNAILLCSMRLVA